MDELESIVKSEAGLRDLLESVDDLVAFATLEGRHIYVNRAWREKLGYSEDEVAKITSYQIIHPSHQDDVKETNARLMSGEGLVRVERILVAKDGRHFPVDGSLSCRFKDGKPWYVRAIFHDISERKHAEKMKDDLVSMASHELRNPLMAIRTALHLLNEEIAPTKLERPIQVVGLAMRNCDRMVDLIKAYLDLANLEAGAPLKERDVDVSEFIEGVVELIQPLGLHAGIEIRHEGAFGLRVKGDEDRLAQVLTNLVSNAVKFSKPGGTVRVWAAARDGSARIGVTDTGDGIPMEFRSKIFGKFAQAEGHARGGSGLGLAISKAIIEKHDGEIGFESEVGKGTTFYFDLRRV